MPDYKVAFAGKYLAAVDLKGDVSVKIARVVDEMVEGEKGERKRWIIYFEGATKGMVCNRTNAEILVALCKSRMTEGWVGHVVTLGARDVRLGPETVPGLRIVGSPELKAPMQVVVKLPKKKPITVTLEATGKRQASAAPVEAPEPGSNG